METVKLFAHGRSHAVRLPKAYRFAGNEVGITKVGDMVVLYPKEKGWDRLERALDQFSDDFMERREQPAA